jgi:hypothetical protein
MCYEGHRQIWDVTRSPVETRSRGTCLHTGGSGARALAQYAERLYWFDTPGHVISTWRMGFKLNCRLLIHTTHVNVSIFCCFLTGSIIPYFWQLWTAFCWESNSCCLFRQPNGVSKMGAMLSCWRVARDVIFNVGLSTAENTAYLVCVQQRCRPQYCAQSSVEKKWTHCSYQLLKKCMKEWDYYEWWEWN